MITKQSEKRENIQNVQIDTYIVEEVLATIYNMDVLVSCVLEKLECLEREIKRTSSNVIIDHLIKDTRQLVLIIEQEKSNGYNNIDTLLTQIENS